jgi:hypothetical protein
MRCAVAAAFVALASCVTQRSPTAGAGFAPTVSTRNGAATAHLHVRVSRGDGTPASHANLLEVLSYPADVEPLATPPDALGPRPLVPGLWQTAGAVVQQAEADAEGRATLVVRGAPVRAYAWLGETAGVGEVESGSIVTRAENVYGEVRLVPAVRVRGEVVDADGRMSCGAIVRVAFRSPSDPRPVVLMTTCDANGGFALPPIPSGPVSLRADAADGGSVRVETTTDELRRGAVRLALAR